MEKSEISPKNLLLTERCEKWLTNFSDQDKRYARDLVAHLTLVSGIEFERKLISILEYEAAQVRGPVALFGVRELVSGESVFDLSDGAVNSTPRGTDIGSEGRIATIIRNLARNKGEKFLNHPTLSEIRHNRCNAVFFVDDFIGSGKRIGDYIRSFYSFRTVKSWFSYKKFKTVVCAYSGTDVGIQNVRLSKTVPSVQIVRSCPTIDSVFWDLEQRDNIVKLCSGYAKLKRMRIPLGFGEVGALLVFEHSCPNNCPQILWGSPKIGPWEPLFAGKTIDSEARTIFPSEILRRDPVSLLLAAGEERIAKSARLLVKKPLPAEWLAVLSLCSRGIRNPQALEGVTGMNRTDAAVLVEKCIASGLVTSNWRLTDFGRQELRATKKLIAAVEKSLDYVDEPDYYPYSLRGHT